jgi:misacylated tRNA(Ala) deacylase
MTERLFLDQTSLRETTASVIASEPAGIVLDRTIFYARSGGQPGDLGDIVWDGGVCPLIDTIKGDGDTILHIPAPDAVLPPTNAAVTLRLDWARRDILMRMHTALHLLCVVLPGASVTGGSIGVEKSRLDFDLSVPPPKDEIEAGLNALVAADHSISASWVDSSVLDTNPELVRTLSVKPPRGAGLVRLVRIGAGDVPVDLQPCGGTHVASTGLIGRLVVGKIENKGKQNRRITITLG